MPPMRVLIEAGQKRVFAVALDWPGLARSGKTEDAAIEALLAAVPRYARVAKAAGQAFDVKPNAQVEVVERIPGNATTDFGAPGVVGEADRAAVTAPEARRQAAFVRAAWEVFEQVAEAAPEALRKGPRGGGRDRSKIVAHLADSDRGYANAIGVRRTDSRPIEEVRAEMLSLLGEPSDGSPLGGKRWPARYAARRIAWHAIDHAWEIEDRTEPD